ncbi:MAG: hypothetical protein CML50_21525 [Rhodobacteraceae bacterium]|nr:hypothetical protein [Paracoccaceae bacterium]
MADLIPQQAIATGFDPQFEGAEGMIAPGQEELAQQLMNEPEEGIPAVQTDPGEDLIGGKFRSQDDLLKAYQELERKQSQPGQADSGQPSQSQSYTAEQAVEVYGDDIVNAVGEAGLNMADLMWQADQGGDISQHYDALAEAVGVPRQVVENYVAKAQAGGSEPGEISDSEQASIVNEIGGQAEFESLASWARDGGGMTEAELADYNALQDSGNAAAVRWALKAMQAKRAKGAPSEPKLIRGQAPAETQRRFNSKAEVLEAMNKRDSKGRRLYDVDTEYQRKFAELMNNSDVFG